MLKRGFPDVSAGKESTYNAKDAGDMGSIPGSGRSSGGGTPSLSHVFQELLSIYLFVFGNIEFVLTMLGLCCSLSLPYQP